MCVAEGCSVTGDQLAKVALAVLVYARTGSAAWTGLAYALTFFPPLLTGPALSPLADRYPRRTVMVACCLLQALSVGVMALPGAPIGVLAAAAAAVAGLSAPFKAAQGAAIRDVLADGGNQAAGRARLLVIRETGQLLGLAGAAAAVGVLGAPTALTLDAATFLAAAVLLRLGLRDRPAVAQVAMAMWRRWRVAFADGPVRVLATLVLLLGATAIPDAVIVPLVAQAGAPQWTIGLLLAADCLGVIIGAAWVERLSPARQRALIAPLAALSAAPLVLFAVHPGVVLMGVLLVVSGGGQAYLPLAAGEITARVPAAVVGTANGIIGSGLRASQGAVAAGGGLLADQLRSASAAVAVTGSAGLVLIVWVGAVWHRRQATAGTGPRPPVSDLDGRERQQR
jgi:hypothetical protein